MVQHISIRVPWHDNGWKGKVCLEPATNMSCLKLKNISENRNDEVECAMCGECMVECEQDIPCISEGGAFMSEQELHKTVIHPYKDKNYKTHGHFLETEVTYPPYSLPARPYSWLSKKNIATRSQIYGINYKEEYEPEMNFTTDWVQDARNHRAIFDFFYKNIITDESLCILYAKQVPFIEDNRRIIIGIGHVKKIIPAIEHNHTDKGELRSMTWETMICHSIRENNQDGFIIPYQEMMEYAEKNPDFDISSITVFAPQEAFSEFSYATEHLSYDSVIDVILSCIKSFDIIGKCLNKDYSNVKEWLNKQLEKVWQERGAFPGLGAMLTAFGIEFGMPMAKYIKEKDEEYDDIWEYLDRVMDEPKKYLPEEIASSINPILQKTWKALPDENKKLFQLLSRIDLTIEQAKVIYDKNVRQNNDIDCTNEEIIENPYILYEKTRLKNEKYSISIQRIDRALFPEKMIAEKYPLSEPSAMTSSNDERRIRAVIVSILEECGKSGHTFLPSNILIDKMENLILEPSCKVTTDIILAIEDFMKTEIVKRQMKDGIDYYKLVRIAECDKVIENTVYSRLNAEKIAINANWRNILDDVLEQKIGKKEEIDEEEEAARKEKVEALKKLAESKLSVLVGEAGTGKTSVLSALCREPSIRDEGVLLLAPTGKATVRLKESVNLGEDKCKALNIAQFLIISKRYDGENMCYKILNREDNEVPERTVIIDEASMLTEEMFSALLEAVSNVKRIIFVGDPNQLPPIGMGKPFVDLVYLLKSNKAWKNNAYGELRINRRQQKGEKERLDVKFSKCFTKDNYLEEQEDIISKIVKGDNPNISIETWSTREELEEKLLKNVANEIGMNDVNDKEGFDKVLGATFFNNLPFFYSDCRKNLEKWQVMAPVRNMAYGVTNINRIFHKKYRTFQIALSKRWGKYKRIPVAFGDEEIVYGDKVINIKNLKREKYVESEKTLKDGYIANGEIGIVCGWYHNWTEKEERKKYGKKKDYLHVSFASQDGVRYTYKKEEFGEENQSVSLELAYALTVHKSQGSQFEKVFLVLAEPCRILSKEMLYTALTRQEKKIVILYNDEPYKLLQYTADKYSDIAKRFTDLFFSEDAEEKPQIIKVGESFYDEKLIHRTARGELVRSKSEVIIANALYSKNLKYLYEPELILQGKVKRPDFKITDVKTGKDWYWEHCGMMSDAKYAKRWEDKEKFYAQNGIIEGKNLIVTKEYENEGIKSDEIYSIIERIFG